MLEHIRRTLDSAELGDEVRRVLLGQRLGLDPMRTPDQYLSMLEIYQETNLEEYINANSWERANDTAMKVTAATIQVAKDELSREKARIAPALSDLERARKAKIATATAGINAKYKARAEELSRGVKALEEKKRKAEKGYIQLKEEGKKFHQDIEQYEKQDQFYTHLMEQLKILKAVGDGIEEHGNEHAFIIDAGFSLEQLVIAGFGKIYTTLEEMEVNPFLEQVADVQVQINNMHPELLKVSSIKEKRASSLLALICDKKEKRIGYTLLLGREMMEFVRPFLREKRIPMSVMY